MISLKYLPQLSLAKSTKDLNFMPRPMTFRANKVEKKDKEDEEEEEWREPMQMIEQMFKNERLKSLERPIAFNLAGK